MDNQLRSILSKNKKQNISILGFFENYPVDDYFVENNSVLILGQSDKLWAHISSSSAYELSIILNKHHEETKYFYSVEDWMVPVILNYGKADWIMNTNRYILEKSDFYETSNSKTITIDKSFAHYIYDNSDFKKFISVVYIAERLDKDISAGIFVNNNLVAWGFTHDDGALGFLHVIKEYREKGLATQILLSLIQQRKKAGKAVFGNILTENKISAALITKLGFSFECKTCWLKLL